MKKPPGRDAAATEKRRKDTETKRPAGNHPAPKTSRNRTFDPDSLLNCMDGMVYVASPDYRIEYMNDAALRRVGRDMTGKRCFKVFHGLEAPCSWCVAELVRQGQTFRMEIQGQLDRRWYSSVLTPLPRRDGTVSVQALVFDITDQKQAQAALSQNDALLRSIIQAAPTGIGMAKNRVIEWTNEQITQITGYTPGELKGKSARILYPSDEEFDRVGRHKYAEIRSRGTGSIVTAWRRKDGSAANIFLSSTPIDPGDLAAGVVFTALDITEKKKAQDELWRSEEKYRALFENAVMGIFQSTPEGRFLRVNPATATMCGFDSPEEMVDSVTDIAAQHYVDPAEREPFTRAMDEQGFVRDFEHRTYRKDGSVFWVSVNARAVRDRQGRITHYEGTHEDIQARKEAEAALRLSEERYRTLFENSIVGIFQSTLAGRYIRVNPAFAQIYGYESPGDVIDSITDIGTQVFADAEDRKRCLAILQEAQFLERFETRTRRKDGSIIWTVINSRIIRDAGGQPLFIEGVIEDITQRRLAEDAQKLNEQRLEALQTLNQMNRATIQELCDFALEEGVRLTGSKIGYLAFLNGDESVMTMFSWSRGAMEQCSVRNLTDVFPVDMTGLWGEAVRQRRPVVTNDYVAPNPLKKGLPDGHVPILRHMNVPVLDGERIAAVVGVGNKESAYDESDVLQLTLLSQGMWRIIQRRRSEEALRASEERFFKVFQSNPIPMTIATLDEGRLIDINESALALSGYSREELIGRTSVDIGLWAYPEERDRLIAELRETGLLRDGLAHFRTKSGSVAPALWSADRIRLGKDELLLTTIHDISQQVEAREKLRQSEETYRLLAENVTDVIWTAALDLAFTYVSPSSERVFGWSASDWMTRRLETFLTPASIETAQRLLREEIGRAGAGSRVVTTELEFYRKDGSAGWYEVSSQVIRDDDGTPLSLIGVTRDIAERKNAEKQNALLEQQLRQAQKMEAVGTLAGGIAHDFNNILFAVIGYAELCLEEEQDGELRWNLSQILSACNRAKTLVSQILAFSRQVEQEQRPLDVVPLAKEAVKFLRSSLPVTIDLTLETPAANSVILADATQIHQVLMNLCTNAAHAMRASGGRLGIRLDNAAPPAGIAPEGADGAPAEGFLHLSVSDTGQGIEPDQLDRIFDPFFTTKAPGEGTGLGLSVVYGIVKALGGAVAVDSTPGRGSTFDIYLPSAGARGQEPERPAEPIPRGSESVLFVDDESHLVEVMGQVLSALGYRVTTVRESRNALRLFRENPESFDLVITDMTMPDMTGAELAREILRFRPSTPVILCTGYSELISEEEALRMGIRRFLMKPLFMGDVAREIRAVLDADGRGTAS